MWIWMWVSVGQSMLHDVKEGRQITAPDVDVVWVWVCECGWVRGGQFILTPYSPVWCLQQNAHIYHISLHPTRCVAQSSNHGARSICYHTLRPCFLSVATYILLQRIFCCNVYSVATCILLQRVFCCNVYSAATYILLQRIFCRNVYSVATYILLQRIFCCNVYILLQRIFCCNDYSETLQVVLHSLSVELYILSVELYILSVELYILTPYKSLCTQLLNSLGTATLLH